MHKIEMTDAEKDAVLASAATLGAFFKEIGPKYDAENSFAYPSIQAFKDSGLGREKGVNGMRLYQQTKGIYVGLDT